MSNPRNSACSDLRETTLRILRGLLLTCLTALSATAMATENVLFEDHFDDESSLSNWTPIQGNSQAYVSDGALVVSGSCQRDCGNTESLASLNRDPQWQNFELSVRLPASSFWSEADGRIAFRTHSFLWDNSEEFTARRGKGYALQLSGTWPQFDRLRLIRQDCPSYLNCPQATVALAKLRPLLLPIDVRILMSEGSVRVLLNGRKSLEYNDPNPLPAGGIDLGGGVTSMFDDVVIRDLPNLRCSVDGAVNGDDRNCNSGLFGELLRLYVWPTDHVERVDFYLDGRFHRTERFAPFELDGGKFSRLAPGPHEVRAYVKYKDGRKTSLAANFDVEQRPLLCSPDPVVDGNDPACEGAEINGPTWIYWWPNTGIRSVEFYVNQVFHHAERKAPYELDGGTPSYLQPFSNANDFEEFGELGNNEIRAIAKFTGNRKSLTREASLKVPLGLRCSSDRILDGRDPVCFAVDPESRFSGPQWIYWWPETDVASIDFYLSDYGFFPSEIEIYRTELKAPFELQGGMPFTAQDAARLCYDEIDGYVCSYKAVVRFNNGSAPSIERRYFRLSK